MATINSPEVWLRGPLPGIPPLLQPVAHALLQAREELELLMVDFPDELLWERPAAMASPGFHLLHLTGVLDRLFTYASSQSLTGSQLDYLHNEAQPKLPLPTTPQLVERFRQQVDNALKQLANTQPEELTAVRGVGRQQIPSTVIGLLFHAAEHTQRHFGQLLVTVTVLLNAPKSNTV